MQLYPFNLKNSFFISRDGFAPYLIFSRSKLQPFASESPGIYFSNAKGFQDKCLEFIS